ncbi:MAG: hypothetical protein Q8882_08295, partial [Bacillota bacterium]|nr:hypothetical protein [Bacillota bacterium]
SKVLVNGTVQTGLILDYNKNTYVPASMLTKSGVFTKEGNNYLYGSEPVVSVPKNTPKKSAESYLQVVNGKNVVLYTDFYKILKDKGYQFSLVNNNQDIQLSKGNVTVVITKDVSYQFGYKGYTDYDFFVQYIYPLL